MDPLGLLVPCTRAFAFVLSLPIADAVPGFPRFFIALLVGTALPDSDWGSSDGELILVGRELVIGYLLGYPFRFVSDISECLGELLDTARGQTIGSINDPLNGPSGSDLAVLLRCAACALALQGGALAFGVQALRVSLEILPPCHTLNLFAASRQVQLHCSEMLFALSTSFIIFVAAFAMVDVVAALCSRVCTHVSFSTTTQLAKFLTLIALTALSVVYWQGELGRVAAALWMLSF